ncbi:hypothetical protein QBC43DRAFT_245134, partial [Cladorrhinum sp. PSN259]
MQYLESLCRRRGWSDPKYEFYRNMNRYHCKVLVNGREYQTDPNLDWESAPLAQESAAMRAFMVCRNFSINGGMLARNGIVQGLPADDEDRRNKRPTGTRHSASSRASATTTSDSHTGLHTRRSESTDYPIQSLRSGEPSRQSTQSVRQSMEFEPLDMPDLEATSVSDLERALAAHDYNKTQWLLEQRFDRVATGQYAWLTELKKLDYSPLEITDELLEKAILGPWILEPFTPLVLPPFDPEFHLDRCAHLFCGQVGDPNCWRRPGFQLMSKKNPYATGPVLSTKESIEYYCGLAGARPEPEGSAEIELGSVVFAQDSSAATVTLVGPKDNSAVIRVLENLEHAAGALQTLGGSCNTLTFLYAVEEHPKPYVELYSIPFSLIRRLRHHVEQQQTSNDGEEVLDIVREIMPFLPSNGETGTGLTVSTDGSAYITSLAAQFLALALLSYAQAHCGPIMPFFLDAPLKIIVLKGNDRQPKSGTAFSELGISGSLVELTCMGEMTGGPVFAFRAVSPDPDVSEIKLSSAAGVPPVKFDLLGCTEDIVDTWGPGKMTSESPSDLDLLVSISVGGGIITSVPATDGQEQRQLHWSPTLRPRGEAEAFDRSEKLRVGGTIVENERCTANPHAELHKALFLLEDLGTSPSYWELAERELGLGLHGGGQVGLAAALSFNQTWVKMGGTTRKAAMLHRPIYVADLESLFGVQVSVCTGIARRVRLLDLIADVLPAYVAGLVTKPTLYDSLANVYNLFDALSGSNLGNWLALLDHEHQTAFEYLVSAVLHLLRDTGIDRKCHNLVVACIQPNMPFQCFKIPCTKENYWARMLADSESTATFAYVTTQCLETERIHCTGQGASWKNSAALLWTTVSCYEERLAVTQGMKSSKDPWRLKHADAYLIGRPDAALSVQVDRPDAKDEPRLLASLSTIPSEYLYRLFRKGRPGKPRRLREMNCFDHSAESVVV